MKMDLPKSPGDALRIGLPEAINRVMDALKAAPSASISALARATGLDRRTVSKVIDIIMQIQKDLQNMEIAKIKRGRSYIVQLRKRTEKARDLITTMRKRLGRK